MIGWLKGRVRGINPAGSVLVDVGGVGYEVFISLQTLCKLKAEEEIELFIHTHVREDQITLFGFADARERGVFRKLTGVSGIGARMGMNLLSGMSVEELMRAIEDSDAAAIARTPGIGRKTAQRLILELRGKIAPREEVAALTSVIGDVRSALANLGYRPAQIDAALEGVDSDADFETLFKAAMKALA